MTPEEKARIEIDEMLEQAGWVVQDRSELNIRASLGVAIREFVMKDNGESDYTEKARYRICPREKKFGIQVPQGVWHSVIVHESSTILEAKDGAYK